MIPFYRFAEVGVYSLLSFLPFLLLALYPFRERLRFSFRETNLLIIGVTVVQLGLGVWAAFFSRGRPGIISAVSTVIYAGFYFSAVKVPAGKTLFTLLMLTNTQNFVVVAAKCLEGQVFPALAVQPYRWSFSLCMLLVECVVLLPLFIYIKKVFNPAAEKEPSRPEWRYLWLVPATFYLIWYYVIYGDVSRTSLEIALRPSNTAFFFFINLGAFVVYHVIAMLVLEQARNLELSESNHRLAMQTLQYKNLQSKIAEARQAKHDVRHHVVLMEKYLKNRQYQELEEYLNGYRRFLPDDTRISFCENTAVNAVVLYFAEQAKDGNIDFDARLSVPETISVPTAELSVLFGNLLENAVDACSAETCEDKRIVLRAAADSTSLCVTVDNTFAGEIKRSADGVILSTKHPGEGLGLASVGVIAERHGGVFKTEQRGGMFCTSVLLNLIADN